MILENCPYCTKRFWRSSLCPVLSHSLFYGKKVAKLLLSEFHALVETYVQKSAVLRKLWTGRSFTASHPPPDICLSLIDLTVHFYS